MNSILIIPLASGLAEINNPCTLVNLIVFVIFLSWASENEVSLQKFGWTFLGVLTLSNVIINSWPVEMFFYNTLVMTAIRILYIILAVIFMGLGLLHLRDWYELKKGKTPEDFLLKIPDFQYSNQKKNVKPFGLWWLLSIFIPVTLSFLHSIWPMEYYMGVINAMFFFPGSFLKLFILLLIYHLTMMIWPLVFFIFLIIMIHKKIYTAFVKKYASLIKIACSGFMCAMSVGLVYVFL